jgi:hypothetical protein
MQHPRARSSRLATAVALVALLAITALFILAGPA